MRLGVNIDHIATVRQARRGVYPSPVEAALLAESAGATSIVCHLREDRRHIQDEDVRQLRKQIKTHLNLEMAMASDVVEVALSVGPDQITLVPEKREELTTEGGLDVVKQQVRLEEILRAFQDAGIPVSVFVDPIVGHIQTVQALGAATVELHTGRYADATTIEEESRELEALKQAARAGVACGIEVVAGHGLDYDNVKPVAAISEITELNIGFSIISRALFVGLPQAVGAMKQLIG